MAEKGPPKSWKSLDFPERFKTTSGTKVGKNDKKNEYGRFGTSWGSPWALKCRSGEGLKKCLHFCHELDQILSRFLIKISWVFFTCLFESLNLPPNQHDMYGTKQFFRKGCMYANHMIYRVERVCATSLRTGAWPKKTRTAHMFFVCCCIVFFEILWPQFVHQLLIILFNRKWLPKWLHNRCQNH